jgi:hypothetical protein
MQIHSKRTWRTLSTALILAMMALSIAAQQTDSLTVAGQSGSAKVIRVAGRNYVDVEGLARLTNSAMSFNGNQIILTMHGTSADAPPPSAPASGFSKDFVTTGIEAMAQMREWHATLKNAIERGYPLAEDWLAGGRAQAQQALRLASLSASTPADKSVLPFLTNEFNNMRSLCDKYLQLTASRTYIAPNSLDNDPLDQKIRTCAHSLAAMATSNQFVDDGSCQ